MKRTFLLLLFIWVAFFNSYAQPRISIEGTVSDLSDKEPLPFTNIHFKKNGTGTITNNTGNFSITTSTVPDTLIISAIGYETEYININQYKNYQLSIQLKQKDFELDEVLIKPGENPAIRIMKNVIEAKDQNNPMKASTMACNAYTKILVNAVNDKDKQKEKKGIPVFFSEKVSQNIVQQDPYYEKGKIIAERQEGLGFLSDMSILGYSNNLSLSYNFYENTIEIFDKPFISPLSSRAFLFYKYYLKDSLMSEFGKEYYVEFVPKNDRDMAFTGYMKIIDEDWALSEISLSIPQNANLNYVNKLKILQTFQEVNDSLTFFHINDTQAELKITKDKSFLDFDFTAMVNKRTVYDQVKLNFPPIESGNENMVWNQISQVEKAAKNSITVDKLRPEDLSTLEQNAIVTIDSLNNNWKIKSADALSKMFITGYIPGDIIDLGPYLELVKNNKVEGFRYTFAGRTSSALTKNTMLYGHIGYGTRDEEWKYGLGITHKFKSNRRQLITVEYRNDLSKIGDNRSIFLIKENMMVTGEDNVISSIFTSSPLDKLSREIRYRAEYEKEWKTGVTTFTSFTNKTIFQGKYLPFTLNGTPVESFSTNEIMVGLRLSWRENVLDDYCRRFYLTTKYPVINLRITGGQYQLQGSYNEYLTARAVFNHDINIGQTKFEYILESGITLGSVPFPLLDFSRNDQSLGYALYSFNMMNEMEFAADRFVSLMAQYHLNGLILNRIPVLKRMGIREVFSAKVLWSNLSNKHQAVLDYPVQLYDAKTPYTEASIGIENFFQYFRFDLVYRLNHLQNPNVNALGIRARFDVNF